MNKLAERARAELGCWMVSPVVAIILDVRKRTRPPKAALASPRAAARAAPDHVGSGHISKPLFAALFFAEPASTSAESALDRNDDLSDLLVAFHEPMRLGDAIEFEGFRDDWLECP